MNKYYPRIHIFWGLLFLFILAFHCDVPYANLGWGGVEAFFVISVFFLVRKQWGNDSYLNVKKQIQHRIARLYPSYIAVLFVAALYALLVKAIPYDMITHLLSVQNFQWMITGYKSPMQPMTAHTWTLSIEVWGGLIMLILLKILTKRQFQIAMYMVFGIGISYRLITIICGANVWVVSLCPLAHFDAFACGALLAIGMREEKVTKRIGLLSILGIAGIIICILSMADWNGIGFIEGYKLLSSSKNYLNSWFTGNIYLFISLLTVGLVGLLCLHDEKMAKTNKFVKPFVILGDNSYVLYLFHWPILVVIRQLARNWAMVFAATFIVSIVAAFFFDKLYTVVSKKLLGGK